MPARQKPVVLIAVLGLLVLSGVAGVLWSTGLLEDDVAIESPAIDESTEVPAAIRRPGAPGAAPADALTESAAAATTAIARHPIIGRVVDETDQPLAQARVRIGPRLRTVDPESGATTIVAFDPQLSREGRSAADGSFELEALGDGPFDLIAEMDGRLRDSRLDLAAGKQDIGPIRLVLRPGYAIEIRVSDDRGRPIAASELKLVPFDWRASDVADRTELDRRAATDANGVARFSGLEERPRLLSARAGGFLPENGRRIAAADRRIELVLLPSPALLLRVIDDRTGAGIDGATLVDADGSPLTPLRGEALARRIGRPVSASEYLLCDLESNRLLLDVRAADHAICRVDVEDLLAGEIRERLVEMEAAAGVRGRIRRSDGGPAAGVMVLARPRRTVDDTEAVAALVQGDLTAVDPVSGRGLRMRPPEIAARVEADGTFRFEGLGPGPCSLVLKTASGRELREPIELDLEPGDRDLGDLTLPPFARIEGQIQEREGRPLGGAVVELLPADGDEPGVAPLIQEWVEVLASTRSGEDGRFVFDWLEAGRYRVRAAAGTDGPRSLGSTFDLGAGEVRKVELRLQP